MNISAFCFDLDGTLVDSLPDITGVVNLTRARYGLSAHPPAEVKRHIGEGVERLMSGAIPELANQGEARLRELISEFRTLYLAEPHHGGRVYPAVRETLEVLRSRSGAKLAVVTNKLTAVAEQSLAKYLPGIPFDLVVGPDRVSARKPSAAHLLETLQLLQVSSRHAIFVGDSQVDRNSAAGAGVRFFAAAYGFGDIERNTGLEELNHFGELLEKLGMKQK